jgi:chromodomain-helicase-DNA-binding protein 7
MSKEEVEKLLRHGAYDMFQEENEGAAEKESKEFIEQDIDTILERRAKTVIHENTGSKSNAAGGTFSKASFKALSGSETKSLTMDVDIDDPDFWKKMVGEAKFEKNDVLESDKKRSRNKAISYNEKQFDVGLEESISHSSDDDASSASDGSDDSSDLDENSSRQLDDFDFALDIQNANLKKLMEARKEELSLVERKRWGGKLGNHWTKVDTELLVKQLLRYGYGNIDWSLFISKFTEGASKNYDEVEVSSITLNEIIDFFLSTYSAHFSRRLD